MKSIKDDVDSNTRSESEEKRQFSYDDLTRREVRSLIFHLLYAMEAHDYQESLEAIVTNFNVGFDVDIPLDSQVFKLTEAIINVRDELDEIYKPLLANWRFERISVATKLLLRFAVWEILYTDIDERIIINEAVELAKCFAEKDAYRFINGILDKVAKQYRKREEA